MENLFIRDVNEFILGNINLKMSRDLELLEKEALEDNIPIIDKDVQNFIGIILDIHKPKSILEFGTAVGFSSIFMCERLKGDVHIDTLERDEERILKAKENFKKFNYEDKITLIEGDCFLNLNKLKEGYDLIFIDSSKSHYEKLFNDCIQKLNKNGIIILDNILYKGMIVSDKLVHKRKKTIIKNMRNFIQNVVKDEGYSVSIIPIGDGIMILRRSE